MTPKTNWLSMVLFALIGLLALTPSGCSESKPLAKQTKPSQQDPVKQEPVKQKPVTASLSSEPSTQEDSTADAQSNLKPKIDAQSQTSESASTANDQPESPDQPTIEIGSEWTRLSKSREIWIDKKSKQVMFTGIVCLNDGPLEMFICPARTKEHESVIAANCLAKEVHFALVLAKVNPGQPCSWDPNYRPAHGPTIEATLKWQDKATQKTKSQNAKQWIRNIKTKKAMEEKWIFGGSTFWTDPDTNEEFYYADAGELICLSNFSTAMIDVGVESSQANNGLLYETFNENIPEIGTKVYVILQAGPPVEPENKSDKKADGKGAEPPVVDTSPDTQAAKAPPKANGK